MTHSQDDPSAPSCEEASPPSDESDCHAEDETGDDPQGPHRAAPDTEDLRPPKKVLPYWVHPD